ncbi:hypothetical protein TNCV_3945951 [Trichonephila clavipes]|nr:hypothetical protein TNCV_3945951 [Trichonephila clavipes]
MICKNASIMVTCDQPLKTTRGPNPREDIAAQTITELPPCFTVGTRQSTCNASVGIRQTNTRSVVRNNVNEDSSDQMTCSHYSCVQFRWSRHHCNLFAAFLPEINGFRIATLPWMFAVCNTR